MRNPVAGAERKTKLAGTDGKARCDRPSREERETGSGGNGGDDVADYLLDVLTNARQLASAQGFRFLAYLLGLAVEEARHIGQTGTSWAAVWRDRSSRSDRS